MPALLGESERAAQMRAQQDGLQLASIAEIRSSDYPAGTVVAQNPPPQRRRARTYALLVNRGERGTSYVMPDLIGVNGDRAADLLRVAGLPRLGGRRSSVSRRPSRHRAAAEPAGGLPDCAGRSHLPRGEPLDDRTVTAPNFQLRTPKSTLRCMGSQAFGAGRWELGVDTATVFRAPEAMT